MSSLLRSALESECRQLLPPAPPSGICFSFGGLVGLVLALLLLGAICGAALACAGAWLAFRWWRQGGVATVLEDRLEGYKHR